ncbi:(R)-mandelonitrile lyase [Pedobacter gandavensis]|nr:cupin domain-containing protein [Pedobacter gandavensis]
MESKRSHFTGSVKIDPLINSQAPAHLSMAMVTFEAGARTSWHSHPLGQTLVVMAGAGWMQREGGPIEDLLPGDVLYFLPGEKHWHGATATTSMSHVTVQEKQNDSLVNCIAVVTDEQYLKSP